MAGRFFADLRLGAGVLKAFHPIDSYKQEKGAWVNKGTAGKTMLMIPAGISIGYNGYRSGTYIAPFICYEVVAAGNYNRIIPVLPFRCSNFSKPFTGMIKTT